jgi:hypothetical protein
MNTSMAEDERRLLAYLLWERAGCPDGRADEFWERAQLQPGADEIPTQGDRMNDSDEFVDAPALTPGERPSNSKPG